MATKRPFASKMSRSTTPSDRQGGHLRTSLTGDEHQVIAAVFRPCSVRTGKITEDDQLLTASPGR